MLWGACDSLHTPRPLGPVYDIAAQAGPALRERLDAGARPRAIFSAVLEELGRRPPVVAVLDRHPDRRGARRASLAGRREDPLDVLLGEELRGRRHPGADACEPVHRLLVAVHRAEQLLQLG